MNSLLTYRKRKGTISEEYVNDLTKKLDEIMSFDVTEYRIRHYLFEKPIRSKHGGYNWAFRYPGATRGCVVLDDEMVIVECIIYTDIQSIYDMSKVSLLDQFVGLKIEFTDGEIND